MSGPRCTLGHTYPSITAWEGAAWLLLIELAAKMAGLKVKVSIWLCSTEAVTRMTEGLAALILSLRRRFSVR